MNVVLVTFQLQMQYIREAHEDHPLFGVLKLVLVSCKILTFAVHLRDLNMIFETVEEVTVSANAQLNIPEVLNTAVFVVNIGAGDVGLDLSTEYLRKDISLA